jgi:hypothetical protein
MLVENTAYHRNPNSNEIIKRQVVEVSCDQCNGRWMSVYDEIKKRRRLCKPDLCRSCRTRNRQPYEIVNHKHDQTCAFCRNSFKTYKNEYCSQRCFYAYQSNSEAARLRKTFESNPDELAYLCGLILGDGHLYRSGAFNTRIHLAFNARERHIQCIAAKVLRKLRIRFYRVRKEYANCQSWGFVVPDQILSTIQMLWHRDKHSAQPKPIEKIQSNANFVAGLINSDGCYTKIRNTHYRFSFRNTVHSIVESFAHCLSNHDIKYTRRVCLPKIDKRTGKLPKVAQEINIARNNQIEKLRSLCKFPMKGATTLSQAKLSTHLCH